VRAVSLLAARIRSVLVANRGEIAVRVMRTCRRLGIRTVAVYSDADAGAVHVREADEAVRIGPAPARASYLDMDAVIGAALRAGVDAVHPGYGFLSENARFAERCAAEGLVFVGPSAAAIAAMGSKIEAKRIAEAAGVPTVPGYHGEDGSPERLAQEAARIAYPVLIKASAGGGGRGMRRVLAPNDVARALEDARNEAASAFGDSTVFIEKLVQRPRHIEVQLFGDGHGNLVHLGERDCSVQRSNQKLLEETPAPNLPAAARESMIEAALKLGRAIGYDSAGTVEFVMDAEAGEPFFLEMNTRLQVEHPVTEAVTGLDLVEWQLRVAAGEALPLAQEQIRFSGHAIEARVTAERADLGFQPSHGTVLDVEAPRGVRLDSGIGAGSVVGLHYDSMLAKVIGFGRTREDALVRLGNGLESLAILGVTTIQPFLLDAIRHPIFAEGRATTGFIGEAFPEGWQPRAEDLRWLRACAAVAWLDVGRAQNEEGFRSPWALRSAVRVMGAVRPASTRLIVSDVYGSAEVEVRVSRDAVVAMVEGETVDLGRVRREDGLHLHCGTDAAERVAVTVDGPLVAAARRGLAIEARVGLRIEAISGEEGEPVHDGGSFIRAPLPGLVTKVQLPVGTRVEKGAVVLQMEAMKLVYSLTAAVDGVVAKIHVEAGATVVAGAVLAEIREDGETG
jgi:acetyl/propionyl-CoA carboxylase alpha subunit